MSTRQVVKLDPVSADVADAIQAVMFEAYRVEAGILGVEDFMPLRRTTAEIVDAPACFLGIWLDGGLAAVAELEDVEPGLVQISSLVVSPAHFREGLATALLRDIVEAHLCVDLSVSTGIRNTPALQLYATHGFSRQSYWTTPDGIPMVTLVRRGDARLEIRPETASDIDDIREINIEAFREHPISRQTEHLIVDALRDTGALEVSLVAIVEGQTVGHIAFSKAHVGDSGSGWFLLGPIAVLPGMQGQGIGSALVGSGLAELRTREASGCVLVGDPGYYSRFGFSTFPDLSYAGVPHEYVLGLAFDEARPCGSIVANKAFEIEPEQSAGRA